MKHFIYPLISILVLIFYFCSIGEGESFLTVVLLPVVDIVNFLLAIYYISNKLWFVCMKYDIAYADPDNKFSGQVYAKVLGPFLFPIWIELTNPKSFCGSHVSEYEANKLIENDKKKRREAMNEFFK